MKILVICQYYHPEPFRVADICEALVAQGNEVDVVTSFPNYPMGEIYADYKGGKHKEENINGVNVRRVFTIGRKTGAIFRFINYYAYSVASTLYTAKLKKEYDVVFVYQLSPVMMANAALKYKKEHGKKVVLYCLDLWPESLTLGGIKKNGFVYRYYKKIAQKIYENADEIIVSSRRFVNYFEEVFKIKSDKVQYLPQYAEDVFFPLKSTKGDCLNITFAGNIGTTQSIETILYSAQRLKEESIHFHFYGDGSGLDKMLNLCKKLQLENVTFYGRVPLENLPEIYAESDALIVTLSDNEVLSMSFPGKIQSYMAAGKPVIAAVNGEAARIIEEAACGFVAAAEDVDGLVSCVKKLICADSVALGKNSRAYYEENFQKDDFIRKLLDLLAK